MTALKWLGHLSLQGIRLWNVCMLKVYHWGIRFTLFCLDCFSFSVSNSPCQHLPSVPTQLGSIQLSCPESERGEVKQCVCVIKREQYDLFITNSLHSFSHFFLCRSNVLQLLWDFVSYEEAFVFSDVPNLSSWCCARCNLAKTVAVQFSNRGYPDINYTFSF